MKFQIKVFEMPTEDSNLFTFVTKDGEKLLRITLNSAANEDIFMKAVILIKSGQTKAVTWKRKYVDNTLANKDWIKVRYIFMSHLGYQDH